MKIRNMTAGILVAPGDFYKPDETGDRSPVNKPAPKMNANAMAAYVASLPRRQRRKIDQNAKRALRKYGKHKSATQ